MKINRENYEVFFMDYLDGNLPDDQVDRFLDFLEQNPDLKAELQLLGDVALPVSDVTFDDKSVLYKTESDKVVGDGSFTAVAFMEGDLDEFETRSFLHQMERDPNKVRDFDLLMKTRLQPDLDVVFPFKQELYKESASHKLFYWGSRVAAAVLVSAAVWSAFQFDRKKIDLSSAMQASVVTEQSKEPKTVAPEPKPETVPVAAVAKPAVPITSEVKASRPVAVRKIEKVPEKVAAERISPVRETTDTPRQIQPLAAELKSPGTPVGSLRPENIASREILAQGGTSKTYTVDEYLLRKVLKIEKQDNPVTLQSVFRSGLDLASNISERKVSYETEEGKVSKIKVDTRLLAFSIPVRRLK